MIIGVKKATNTRLANIETFLHDLETSCCWINPRVKEETCSSFNINPEFAFKLLSRITCVE